MTAPPEPGGEATETGIPTCYRHPGRETWIRCTRCDRPICPDCMRDAAVGFHCPECVSAGQRTTRAPKTTYGAALARRPGRVTYALIALNVVAFGLKYLHGANLTDLQYALIDCLPGHGVCAIGVADGEWYRLFTAMFLHVGILHIALNMYLLYLLGPALESLIGWWRFLALYLVSGLGGSALSYLTGQGGEGASGAIFGLFAAYWIFARRLNRDTSQITLLIVINLVFSFVVPGIGYWAHLGGLAAGAISAVGIAYAPQIKARAAAQSTGLALSVVLSAALVALRTAQLT